MKVGEWLAAAAVAVGLALTVRALTEWLLVDPARGIAQIVAIAAIVVGAYVADERITKARAAAKAAEQRFEG
jgi:hypothetical protein